MARPFTDFCKAWGFLVNHKMFNDNFHSCLDIEVFRVNPKTEMTDHRNPKKNTATRVWLECGPYLHYKDLSKQEQKHLPKDYTIPSIDEDLTVGAPTFEEAIIKLANRVFEKYGKREKAQRRIARDLNDPIERAIQKDINAVRQEIQKGLQDIKAGRYYTLEELQD